MGPNYDIDFGFQQGIRNKFQTFFINRCRNLTERVKVCEVSYFLHLRELDKKNLKGNYSAYVKRNQ